MMIDTECLKCGTKITLDFGDMTRDEAIKMAKVIDEQSRDCPGYHVEIGGWRERWQLDNAISRAYDLGEGVVKEFPTDEEHVAALQAEGGEVYDGGSNTVPGLPSIHGVPGLKHFGFGTFGTDEFTLVRMDSPRGTRFYVKEPK